jgi:hypothetical protein
LVIEYRAVEKVARACELVIKSDDPQLPVKCLDVIAHTIWEPCCGCCGEPCKSCCEEGPKECRKEHRHECCGEHRQECCDEEEDEQIAHNEKQC